MKIGIHNNLRHTQILTLLELAMMVVVVKVVVVVLVAGSCSSFGSGSGTGSETRTVTVGRVGRKPRAHFCCAASACPLLQTSSTVRRSPPPNPLLSNTHTHTPLVL